MSLNTTSQTQEAITALDTLVKQNGALIEIAAASNMSIASDEDVDAFLDTVLIDYE